MVLGRASRPAESVDDHRLPARLLEGGDAFLALDREGRIEYLNEAAERLLGRRRADVLGGVAWQACAELAGSTIERECLRAARKRERALFEARWTAGGLWLEVTAEPWDEGLAVFLRDVSERKRRERRDLYFRVALEAISGGASAREVLLGYARCTAALTGWPYAEIWRGDAAGLSCLDVVRFDGPGHAELEASARGRRLEPGVGIVGRALPARRPTLIADLDLLGEPRAALARAAGFSSALVVPIHAGDRPVGAVLFFSAGGADDDWFRVLEEQHEVGLAFERRFALEALRASEERHRILFHDSPAPMWIYDPATLRILTLNQAAVQLYGYSREELLSMSLRDLRPAEDIPALEAVTRDQDGERWRTGSWRHVKKDGTVFHVQVASHGLELDGRRVRVVVITDLTSLRESTRKLREQATLLESANDAIVVRGALDDVVTYWNRGAERIYGRSAAEAIGLRFGDASGAWGGAPEQARSALAKVGEWTGEMIHRRRDRGEAVVATRCSLVRDDSGAPVSILSIGTDVTERKKLEAQYLRAQRMESIGTLAGGIAHDLNNVLAPILMCVPLIRDAALDEEQNEMLDSIEMSARRGAQMVRQVLLFARGLSGERVPLQPAALLEETRRIAVESMPKTIQVRLEVARDLPVIEADSTQLQQVLINLAINARDAMPDGGVLTIGAGTAFFDSGYVAMNPAARAGLHVVFEVADTGSGIPPEIRDRIFDPFFTTKEVGKGTGLGLSTSLAIVKSHGGFFNVYSEPGKGTSFKLYLPALGERIEVEAADAARMPPPRGRGELVLIVDDEAAIRTVARRTLEVGGYRVLEAGNGAEALAAYARAPEKVRAVIVDMSMPVMDGAATIRALQHLEADVRIVAASGLGANGAFARATSAGVRHFLQKPYTAELLLRTVRDVLDGRQA